MAVCYHGNHRVSHALTHHVDLRQMMHCIQCLCKSPRPVIISHFEEKNNKQTLIWFICIQNCCKLLYETLIKIFIGYLLFCLYVCLFVVFFFLHIFYFQLSVDL